MQRRTDSRRSLASSVSSASKAERCCPSHSPTLRPWIDGRRMRDPGLDVVLRGGALEPEPRARLRKSAGKSQR
jgi:hypothetical protein